MEGWRVAANVAKFINARHDIWRQRFDLTRQFQSGTLVMTSFIRASALLGFRELVGELGGQPAALLKKVHLRSEILEHEENLVPLRSFLDLLETSADSLGCPTFGMKLASKQGIQLLGPLALLGLNSPTIESALRTMLQHLDFHCPASISEVDCTTDPCYPRVTFDLSLLDGHVGRQIFETGMGNLYHELRVMTQGTFVPQAVLFRHPAAAPTHVYQEYFHCRVHFEQDVNAVVMRPADLAYRLGQANPQMRKLVADYVRQTSKCHPMDIPGQVRFLIKRMLPTQACSIREVARHLCMHERTLQRHLKKDELVFEEILDAIRLERATELLRDSDQALAQIAAALGYSEQAAFSRACKRWFNVSPSRFRNARRHIS